MSNLSKYLNENNSTDFDSAKALMEPLKVNVRYLDNLYRFHYLDGADLTDPIVRECAGIILEMGTNKVVCYGMDAFDEMKENTNLETLVEVTESIEGSQIRIFYYNGAWKVATTKSIDAGQAYWDSPKSFKTLFFEAVNGINFPWENLDPNCTYSFVLQHPESRQVKTILSMRLYHVATRNNQTLDESFDHPLDLIHPHSVSIDELNDLNSKPWTFQGYVARFSDGSRMKIKNPTWQKVADLKGNYSNIGRRFLELKDDAQKTSEFLKYFPEYIDGFDYLSDLILNLPENLWKQFKYYMIDQNGKITRDDPYYYGVIGLYVRYKKSEGKEKTTMDTVRDYLNSCSNDEIAKIIGLN